MYNSKQIRRKFSVTALLIVSLFLFPIKTYPQPDDLVKAKADNLIHQHYFKGIPYFEAHSLGHDAVPYLLSLLQNSNEKEFWVNIIVTLGFIESNEAFDPLVLFLEETEGEVDVQTFKALLSIPFAIGCIASSSDSEALNYLISIASFPVGGTFRWSFKGQNIDLLLSQEALTGLAVSGRPEAKKFLLDFKQETESNTKKNEVFVDTVNQGLEIMNRIEREGRSHIFNP